MLRSSVLCALVRSSLLAGVCSVAAGCDRGPAQSDAVAAAGRVADLLPVVVPANATVPSTRDGILRELSPMPVESLLVVYEVEGPGGLRGNLEVLARPGGFRRENWTLAVPLGNEGERRLAGSTIQTPEGVWVEGQPPEDWTPSPLGALADAYLELDQAERAAVVAQLRELSAGLTRAREDAEPSQERVLDVPCHETRVASIEMCIWEATGLPLRYESEGLRMQAINIDGNAPIGQSAFEVPFSAPHAAPIDAAATVRAMAAGDLSEVAPLLHPGLRVPSAA